MIRIARLLVPMLLLECALALSVACSSAEAEDGAAPSPTEAGASSTPDAAPDAARTEASDAGRDAALRTCSDQGFCYTALPPDETLRSVWGDGVVVWAVSEEGDVLRWDGATWNIHVRGLGALFAIWGSGPTDIWIGGEKGLFHGKGASPTALVFTPEPTPGSALVPVLSIWGSSASNVWAVGGRTDDLGVAQGKVLRYVPSPDAGGGWRLDALSNQPLSFRRVWGSVASGVWVSGDDGSDVPQAGGVYRRPPSASAFARIVIPAYDPELTPDYGIPMKVTAGGVADGGAFVLGNTLGASPGYWHASTADAGAYAWRYVGRAFDDVPLHAVWSIGADEAWACGAFGRLRRWDGTGWRQAALMVSQFPLTEPLYAIWGTASDDFWVVGHDTAIHRVSKEKP